MTLDIRAITSCNIGPLISASISDDYIQGSGLIKTSGSCEISGIYTPAPGDIVTFTYSKSGVVRYIPRKLRVLSSFADPFRRITSIELGCKLTYLQDLTDPINWDAFDDPENEDRDVDEIVTIPIYASSIMQKCCTELGVTPSQIPLTNRFSIAEFDFSGGYVDILSDLLISESYCGFLDLDENLVVFSLDNDGGDGPLINSEKLIDIGPIGVGQLPGNAVVVSYSTLKLKAPDGTELQVPAPDEGESQVSASDVSAQWGKDISTTESQGNIPVKWKQKNTDNEYTNIYPTLTKSTTTTTYKIISYTDEDGKTTRKNVVDTRIREELKTSVIDASNLYSQYLSNDISVNVFLIPTTTTETFEYNQFGDEIKKTTTTYKSAISELGSLGLDLVFSDGYVNINNSLILTDQEIVTSQILGNYRTSKTQRFASWPQTISGQQGISRARELISTSTACSNYINSIYELGLFLVDEVTTTDLTGSRAEQAPLLSEIANANYADTNNASSNSYRTESKSEVELATGSSSAQRRIEFSLPYAPDDIFIRTGTTYVAESSDAAAKAKKYGIVQNRMLLGNRSGMNIQTAPEYIPTRPFSSIFIEAGGVIGLYKLNGTSWTIDDSGIIVSTDAMFWGTAGRTS